MIFISYSHKDEKLKKELETHLKGRSLHGFKIEWWVDTHIPAGAKWREQIDSALDRSRVAILLVSPEFLASDFIARNELPKFREKERNRGLTVLWVLLSACVWEDVPGVGDTQAVAPTSRPLAELTPARRAKVWKELVRRAVEVLKTSLPSAPMVESAVGSRPKKETDAFHIEDGKEEGGQFAIEIDCKILSDWWCGSCLSGTYSIEGNSAFCPGYIAFCRAGSTVLKMPWKLPEPQLQAGAEQIGVSDRAKNLAQWCAFEKVAARLYPRYRDAHLAFLLHVRHQRKPHLREPDSLRKADLDQIHRILMSLLRKQGNFVASLERLSNIGDDTLFHGWRSGLRSLPACHLAMLWGLDKLLDQYTNPVDQNHWLHQCSILIERMAYWLLQAHAVARPVAGCVANRT